MFPFNIQLPVNNSTFFLTEKSANVMFVFFCSYGGNTKTQKPETEMRNRNPESGIGNRNTESGIRNPESGIREPQITENKFFCIAVFLHSFA